MVVMKQHYACLSASKAAGVDLICLACLTFGSLIFTDWRFGSSYCFPKIRDRKIDGFTGSTRQTRRLGSWNRSFCSS